MFISVADIKEPDPSQYGHCFLNHPGIEKIISIAKINCGVKFSFKYTNPVIVTDIANSLPASKAVGYDNIQSRLVKDGISFLATPLSILFNALISRN